MRIVELAVGCHAYLFPAWVSESVGLHQATVLIQQSAIADAGRNSFFGRSTIHADR